MDYRDNPFQHGRSHQLNLVRQRELMHSLREDKDWPVLYLYAAVALLVAMLMIGILIKGE